MQALKVIRNTYVNIHKLGLYKWYNQYYIIKNFPSENNQTTETAFTLRSLGTPDANQYAMVNLS
jgi:hypothetical protein